MMKVITCNVNGIRSANRKGFFAWLRSEDPDFICLQETKAQSDVLSQDEFVVPGYQAVFSSADKKGYSGVGIYSKYPVDSVSTELGHPYFDTEGRFIQVQCGKLRVVSLYLPSGTSGDARQAIKMELLDYFYEHYLEKMIQDDIRTIICGDWNIAHTKQDVKNWRQNQKNSGFLPEERAWLDRVFDECGWVDAFRALNQEDDMFTWWSYRASARA